jgi:hypothetical protein
MKRMRHVLGEAKVPREEAVTMTIPLLIRLLEYAREDAKNDMALHQVAEKVTIEGAKGKVLTMDVYKKLVP